MRKENDLHGLLVEGYLGESPILSPNKFRRYSEGQRNSLSLKLTSMSLKLMDKLSRKNSNIKTIDMSKGDITKFAGYSSIISSITSIRKLIPYGYRNKDLLKSLTTLDNSLSILNTYKNEFSRAYREGDEVIVNIYRFAVAAIAAGVLDITSKYVTYDEENVKLSVVEEDLGLTAPKTMISALADFNNRDLNGELVKLFKFQKADVLAEESNVLTEGSESVLSKLITLIGNAYDGVGKGSKYAALTVTVVLGFVMLARFVITRIYSWRVDISSSLEEAASILYQELPTVRDPNIREKQRYRADKLMELSRKVDIEIKTTDKSAARSTDKLDSMVEREFNSSSDSFEFSM